MDTSERLLLLEYNNHPSTLRIMGLLQDVIRKTVMLLIQILAHFGQPYLFKILLSPQFFPSPQQLEELIGLHPGATILNIEKDLDSRNVAGEIGRLSGGLVKDLAKPTSLNSRALEGEFGQLSGGLLNVPTDLNGLPSTIGGSPAVQGEPTGALNSLPAVGKLPGFGALSGAASRHPGVIVGPPESVHAPSTLTDDQAGQTSVPPAAEAGAAVVKEVDKSGSVGLLRAASGGSGERIGGSLAGGGAPSTAVPAGAPLAATSSAGSDVIKAVPAASIDEGLLAQLGRFMDNSGASPASAAQKPSLGPPATPTTPATLAKSAPTPKSITGFRSADPGLDEFVGKSVPVNASTAPPAPQAPTRAQNPAVASPVENPNPMDLAGVLGQVAEGGLKNISVVGGGGLPWAIVGKKG